MGTDLNLFQQANSVEIFIPAIPYQGLNNELSRRKMLNGKKYPMRNKIESKDFNSNRRSGVDGQHPRWKYSVLM